jgi:hypothetical protein
MSVCHFEVLQQACCHQDRERYFVYQKEVLVYLFIAIPIAI